MVMTKGKVTIIDGKVVAATRLRALAQRITKASQAPRLGIIVATDDPATKTYINAKCREGKILGMGVTVRELDPGSSLDEVKRACLEFNADSTINAYIVQLPLPDAVDPDAALAMVLPEKDADGLSPANLQKLYAGKPSTIPATPKGILTLLEAYEIPVSGQTITVVGLGRLTGQPLSALFEQRGATVIRCNKDTPDIPEKTREADILVSAVGKPGLITADMVKPGATVIDVGTTLVNGKIVGDVDYENVRQKASAITPVPGGVGAMTVVSLLENVAELAQS